MLNLRSRVAVPRLRASAGLLFAFTITTAVVAIHLGTPTSASADALDDALAHTKTQSREIKGKLAKIDESQSVVSSRIAAYTRKIRDLDEPIRSLDASIANLAEQIRTNKEIIITLREDYRLQLRQIKKLEGELKIAQKRRDERLVEIYTSGSPSYATAIIGASSVNELIDRGVMAEQLADLDKEVISGIDKLERKLRVKRAQNTDIRRQVRERIASIEADEAQLERDRADLAARQAKLDALRAEKQRYLSKLQHDEHGLEGDLEQLDEASRMLQQAIESGVDPSLGALVPGGPSPSGLIWPVNGPVVSGFGQRWGRLHAGVDIAVPAGTPIFAAATGVVTHAGWMGGYGNLVLIQHAGGLTTAYAHQSKIGAVVGQVVVQGQLVGYIGCTGHCFGDHLHFETRVNGVPVDPMRFL